MNYHYKALFLKHPLCLFGDSFNKQRVQLHRGINIKYKCFPLWFVLKENRVDV